MMESMGDEVMLDRGDIGATGFVTDGDKPRPVGVHVAPEWAQEAESHERYEGAPRPLLALAAPTKPKAPVPPGTYYRMLEGKMQILQGPELGALDSQHNEVTEERLQRIEDLRARGVQFKAMPKRPPPPPQTGAELMALDSAAAQVSVPVDPVTGLVRKMPPNAKPDLTWLAPEAGPNVAVSGPPPKQAMVKTSRNAKAAPLAAQQGYTTEQVAAGAAAADMLTAALRKSNVPLPVKPPPPPQALLGERGMGGGQGPGQGCGRESQRAQGAAAHAHSAGGGPSQGQPRHRAAHQRRGL